MGNKFQGRMSITKDLANIFTNWHKHSSSRLDILVIGLNSVKLRINTVEDHIVTLEGGGGSGGPDGGGWVLHIRKGKGLHLNVTSWVWLRQMTYIQLKFLKVD